MPQRLIFVSSVQKELQQERYEIRDYVNGDPLLNKHFTVFLFEDLPPKDRRPDEVYLDMVKKSDIYVGLFGSKYGKPNADGFSPVEQEYLCAREHAKHRIILIKEIDASARDSRMNALILKAQNEVVRNEFSNITKLIESIYAGLVNYLEEHHIITTDPFDAALNTAAVMDDIAPEKISWFLKKAREERNYPLSENTPPADALRHLDLIHDGHLKNSALLLFAKQPQKFFIQAETKCLHFHGTTIAKPIPSYQIYNGTVFDQVDAVVDFVLSKLNRSVTPQTNSPASVVEYEIPYMAIREAIVNAVAHRDYTSNAAVQVMVFADRVEVWNPGSLPAGLVPESLRSAHSSIPRNLHLAEPLFLTHYIEKAGTGTLDMIALCTKAELPEPDFKQVGGQFVVTLWRDWLTDDVLASLDINDRQKKALQQMKISKRMNNSEYQYITGAIKKTSSRDLDDLVTKKILVKSGTTGRGVTYELGKKRDIKGTKETSLKSAQKGVKLKGDIKGTNGTSSKLLEKSSGISKGAIKGPSKKTPGNGTLMGHMGHSKRPKTKGVIKGSKGTLRHGSMKPSKSRKLKPTVRKAKKKSKNK
jgi:predicted HTH transcriptional regulator